MQACFFGFFKNMQQFICIIVLCEMLWLVVECFGVKVDGVEVGQFCFNQCINVGIDDFGFYDEWVVFCEQDVCYMWMSMQVFNDQFSVLYSKF